MRTPCASSSAAVMRTVELLPFVPTTWIAPNRSCGEPSAVSSRRMRSRPKRMPNSSSPSRCSSLARAAVPPALARRSGRGSQRVALLAQAGELVALGLRPPPPAPCATKPCVGELAARRASISASSQPRRSLDPARGRAEVDGVGRQHARSLPPGTATVAAGSPPSGDHSQRAQPRDVRRRALVALGLEPRGQHRRRRGADAVAPAAQRLHRGDRARDLRLGVRVDQRRVARSASAAPSAGRRRRGRATRSPRSRTGSPGCAIASVSASTCSAKRATSSSSSAYRRGLTISRYQSHSSP